MQNSRLISQKKKKTNHLSNLLCVNVISQLRTLLTTPSSTMNDNGLFPTVDIAVLNSLSLHPLFGFEQAAASSNGFFYDKKENSRPHNPSKQYSKVQQDMHALPFDVNSL